MPQSRLHLLIILSVVSGLGLSFIEWGDPQKIHGTGLPFPMHINGLAETSPAELKSFADLSEVAYVANSAIAMSVFLFLWAGAKLCGRLIGR